MKKCISILTMAVLLTGFTPHTESHDNWTRIGYDNDFEIFADLKNIVSDYFDSGIWIKIEHYQEQEVSGIKFYISKTFYSVNCRDQTLKVLSLNFYNADGQFVDGQDTEKWQAKSKRPAPNSVGFVIYQAACQK